MVWHFFIRKVFHESSMSIEPLDSSMHLPHLMPSSGLYVNIESSPRVLGKVPLFTYGMITMGYSRPLDLCMVWIVTASSPWTPSTGYVVPFLMPSSMSPMTSEMVMSEPSWLLDMTVVSAWVISLFRP